MRAVNHDLGRERGLGHLRARLRDVRRLQDRFEKGQGGIQYAQQPMRIILNRARALPVNRSTPTLQHCENYSEARREYEQRTLRRLNVKEGNTSRIAGTMATGARDCLNGSRSRARLTNLEVWAGRAAAEDDVAVVVALGLHHSCHALKQWEQKSDASLKKPNS
eukprot:6207604-Pleurochrysis_carterae.AAC.1